MLPCFVIKSRKFENVAAHASGYGVILEFRNVHMGKKVLLAFRNTIIVIKFVWLGGEVSL